MIKNFITIHGQTTEVNLDKESRDLSEHEINDFFRKEGSKILGFTGELTKYYLNENLNFLCGSGTSISIGGKTVNNMKDNPFALIIYELKSKKKPTKYIENLIKFFESNELLEEKFDRINQEYLYYSNNIEDVNSADEIKEYLDKALKIFVENYIPFPSEYVSEKLSIHELFINKILSRKETLNRPKIFTLNYDLAFENACEKIDVSYNNGFRGVHVRKFNPDTFYNETYIKQDSAEKGKQIANYLNIYKLHGSISWQRADNINDLYNLKEVQISDTSEKEKFSSNNLIIFPIQTKKSYSLDLPYSELFRNFSKCLTESQNTLVVIGYSFSDDHINNIIKTGLYNPSLTLIVHQYDIIDTKSSLFLQKLKERSLHDNRIIIFEGSLLGDFCNIVKYLIPLNSSVPSKETIIDTLKELIK
ncbi:MAG: SIR2 family protein [Endomicrobium sp.]|jgi:hypothetical protein|nr:SIR2 family protein [Endomicrobium sp.]